MLTLHKLMQLNDKELTQAFCDGKIEDRWKAMFISRIDIIAYLDSLDFIDEAEFDLLLKRLPLDVIILASTDICKEVTSVMLGRHRRMSDTTIAARAMAMRFPLSPEELESFTGIVSRDTLFKYQDWYNPDTIPNETFLKYQTTLPAGTMKLLGLTAPLVDMKIAHIYPYEEVFTRMSSEPYLYYDKDGNVVTEEHILEVYNDNPVVYNMLNRDKKSL